MSRRNPKQKQLAVALPIRLRALLELAASKNGCSVAAEIRRRLQYTLVEDEIDEPVKSFRMEMTQLATLVSGETNQDFRTHPAANAVLRYAINARLARTKAEGPEKFAPGELRKNRWIAAGSDDPQIIGVAMETVLQAYLDRRDKDTEDMNTEDMNKDRGERLAEARAALRRAIEETRESAATPTEPNVEGEKHHDEEEQK
jgi:hypothetical protein